MSTEKTSIWINRLSNQGKLAMHSFLVFFNTGKMDDIKFEIEKKDTEALTIIAQRLSLQNSVEKVNKAISEFNSAKGTELELIKE